MKNRGNDKALTATSYCSNVKGLGKNVRYYLYAVYYLFKIFSWSKAESLNWKSVNSLIFYFKNVIVRTNGFQRDSPLNPKKKSRYQRPCPEWESDTYLEGDLFYCGAAKIEDCLTSSLHHHNQHLIAISECLKLTDISSSFLNTTSSSKHFLKCQVGNNLFLF